MNGTLRIGIGLGALAGLLYLGGPAYTNMDLPMAFAGLFATLGILLALRGSLGAGGAIFWTGGSFALVPRALGLADQAGIAGISDPWLRHLGLALGAIGPVLSIVAVTRKTHDESASTQGAAME